MGKHGSIEVASVIGRTLKKREPRGTKGERSSEAKKMDGKGKLLAKFLAGKYLTAGQEGLTKRDYGGQNAKGPNRE